MLLWAVSNFFICETALSKRKRGLRAVGVSESPLMLGKGGLKELTQICLGQA